MKAEDAEADAEADVDAFSGISFRAASFGVSAAFLYATFLENAEAAPGTGSSTRTTSSSESSPRVEDDDDDGASSASNAAFRDFFFCFEDFERAEEEDCLVGFGFVEGGTTFESFFVSFVAFGFVVFDSSSLFRTELKLFLIPKAAHSCVALLFAFSSFQLHAIAASCRERSADGDKVTISRLRSSPE